MENRCKWSENSNLMMEYHDKEWGVPVHDDYLLFEFLILEGVQSGLNWQLILKKRENYRKAFDNFDFNKIAKYNEQKVEELMNNNGIIRNRRKIESTILNARAFLKVQKEFDSFNNYIWKFVNYNPIVNEIKEHSELPTKTKLSEQMSKELKKKGFSFVGPTILWSFMEAVGMVNDHEQNCFRYDEINRIIKKF